MGNYIIENEVWKDIDEFLGKYKISNMGRVKSVERVIFKSNGRKQTVKGKLVSIWNDKQGYERVTLYDNNKPHVRYVHRLVGIQFIDNPESKETINHKDCNKVNNKLTNLEWSTHRENINHAIDNGLRNTERNEKSYKRMRGENNPSAKLTDHQVMEIRNKRGQGYTLKQLAKEYGLSIPYVSNLCNYKYRN